MNAATWRQARALFEACLELEPNAREELLSEKAKQAPEMVATVRAMLVADDQTYSPLEQVADLAGAVIPKNIASDESLVGVEFGVYRLKKEIGSGGMSTVYLAERIDGKFQQRVAIKVLRPGLDSQAIGVRFRNEQHILARLEHPHIARLLEAGNLPDGRPCFVLEYVKGEAIDVYCDRKKLTLHQRISLFRDVCEAVAFAHGNLILHRDIKPSNILVDEHGQVKLLDFGIAKVLQPGPFEKELHTRTQFRLLTPEYAAPEQLEGLPLTTACDIYSLGMVFFQLLTGSRPSSNMSTTGTRLKTKPSEVFYSKNDPNILRATCEKRQTTVLRARRLLKGDLDTITAVALHSEPQRRYSSATQFREDLDHFLAGKPIAARGDSFFYLFGKFVGRHKLAVGFATMALVSIISGLTLTLIQYNQAVQQRDLARAETRRAERLVDLLTNVFRSSSPGQSKGEDLTAKQVLDRGAEVVFKRLEGDLETQIQLTNAMAVVYRNLGELEQAETLLKEALARAVGSWGEEHRLVANTTRTLASLRSWQREYAASETLYDRAIRIHRGLGDSRELARDLGEISTVLLSSRQDAKAEKALNQALAIHEQLDPPETDRWLSALSNLAVLYYFQKNYEKADEAYANLLAKQKSHFGEISGPVATTLNNIASLRYRQNRLADSQTLFLQALAVEEALYGVDSTFSKGTLRNLGRIYLRMRRYEEATVTLGRAFRVFTKFLGSDHLSTLGLQIDLANALYFQGKSDQAQTHYQESLAGLLEKRGPDYSGTQKANLHLARFYVLEGRASEALAPAKAAWTYFHKNTPQALNAGLAQVIYGTVLQLQDPASQEGKILLDGGEVLLANLPQTNDPLLETAAQMRKLLKQNP